MGNDDCFAPHRINRFLIKFSVALYCLMMIRNLWCCWTSPLIALFHKNSEKNCKQCSIWLVFRCMLHINIIVLNCGLIVSLVMNYFFYFFLCWGCTILFFFRLHIRSIARYGVECNNSGSFHSNLMFGKILKAKLCTLNASKCC